MILHVEDMPHWRLQVAELYDQLELVAESSAELEQLKDGATALTFIKENAPEIDIIISDLNLTEHPNDPQGEDVIAAAIALGIPENKICLFTSAPSSARRRISKVSEKITIFDKYGNHELLTNWLYRALQ